MLELRSGSLPGLLARGNGLRDFVPLVAQATGLKVEKIRKHARELELEYSASTVARKYCSIAGDFYSSLILFVDFMRALVHRLKGLSISSNSSKTTREVRLRIRGETCRIAYPADLVSLGLLWEVFGQEVYYVNATSNRIYDFGANIGLPAVYFHMLNPLAEIICIEPMEENVKLLKQNLRNNQVPSKLIQAIAGRTEGRTTLFYGDQSHALPSTHTRQPKNREVATLPFDQIVSGKGYGLKIDIEGAEGSLAEFPFVIENADWIVGEVHYCGEVEQDLRVASFLELVNSKFVIKKGRPIIYFIGDEILLCESFTALSK
jgi:FkbM family methyltransferase